MTAMGMGYDCPRCSVKAGEPCKRVAKGGRGYTGQPLTTGVHDARRQLARDASSVRRVNVVTNRDVACPSCGVAVGKPCLSGSGTPVNTHGPRITESKRRHKP